MLSLGLHACKRCCMQLHYQSRNPIVPEAATVAKRVVPTNTELRGLCHPSTTHFSLSTDEPWILLLQRIGGVTGRITRSRCRSRHIRPWQKHVSSSVPAIAAGSCKPKRRMVRCWIRLFGTWSLGWRRNCRRDMKWEYAPTMGFSFKLLSI
jgi:hypothetical protein